MSKDFFGEEEEDILNDDEELFTLTDEDGNEIKFEFLDLIELENETSFSIIFRGRANRLYN